MSAEKTEKEIDAHKIGSMQVKEQYSRINDEKSLSYLPYFKSLPVITTTSRLRKT